MNETSLNPPDLAQRIQEKLNSRLAQFEQLIDQQLNDIEARLTKRLNAAENSMSGDLNKLTETGRISRYKLWLVPLIVGSSLTLGLALGSAVGINQLTSMIAERVQTLQQTEQALQGLGMSGTDVQQYQGDLYLITNPGAPRPGVYQNENHPDRWIIRLED